jgi:hypothetical protein
MPPSFRDCVNLNIEQFGKKTEAERARVRQVLEEFDMRQAYHMNNGLDEATAAAKASVEMGAEIKAEGLAKQNALLSQARAQARLQDLVDKHIDTPWRMVNKLIMDIDSTSDAFRKQFEAMLADMIEKHGHRHIKPYRTKSGQDDIVRALYNETVRGKNDAAKFAAAIRDLEDFISKAMENHGIRMTRNEDWRLPQKHDARAMALAGKKKWVDDHMDMVDWDAMSRYNENKPIPNDPIARRNILNEVYDVLVTDGASKAIERGSQSTKSFAARLASRRFISYKDADSWLKAMELYGRGDVFEQLLEYTAQAARDLSLLTHLGTNPRNGARFFRDYSMQRSADMGADTGKMDAILNNNFDPAVRILEGYSGMPRGGIAFWVATAMNNLQAIASSALLGSTSLISLSDIITSGLTHRLNGTPSSRFTRNYLAALTGGAETRRIARRSGAGADGLISAISASERFFGNIDANGRVASLVGWTHRLSFLTQVTEAGRAANTLEFQGFMADNAKKSWRSLDSQFRRFLETYDISEREWDIMRATPVFDKNGLHMLRFNDIFERSDLEFEDAFDVFQRFSSMMASETNRAIPSSSMPVQVAFRGATPRGSIPGEAMAAVSFLKSFPTTMVMRHLIRPLQELPSQKTFMGRAFGPRAQYLALLTVGMVGAGALANQLGALANLQDPHDMTDPAFWGKAALKGGGLGIVGDFIFSDLNTFGGGLSQIIAGPIPEMIDDFRNLTIGNIEEALDPDKDMNFSADLLRFFNSWTPGTRIWWLRGVKERLLIDTLEEMVDPNAITNRRRQIRRLERETGAQHYWRPGQLTPDRPPDFGNAIGE